MVYRSLILYSLVSVSVLAGVRMNWVIRLSGHGLIYREVNDLRSAFTRFLVDRTSGAAKSDSVQSYV
jgi:hypothetical protein